MSAFCVQTFHNKQLATAFSFLCINEKRPSEKAENGISETLVLTFFWGRIPPQTGLASA